MIATLDATAAMAAGNTKLTNTIRPTLPCLDLPTDTPQDRDPVNTVHPTLASRPKAMSTLLQTIHLP